MPPPTAMPPIRSPCPPTYFDRLCTTTAAPCSSGRHQQRRGDGGVDHQREPALPRQPSQRRQIGHPQQRVGGGLDQQHPGGGGQRRSHRRRCPRRARTEAPARIPAARSPATARSIPRRSPPRPGSRPRWPPAAEALTKRQPQGGGGDRRHARGEGQPAFAPFQIRQRPLQGVDRGAAVPAIKEGASLGGLRGGPRVGVGEVAVLEQRDAVRGLARRPQGGEGCRASAAFRVGGARTGHARRELQSRMRGRPTGASRAQDDPPIASGSRAAWLHADAACGPRASCACA